MWQNISEQELKNKIAQEYFKDFNTTRILGKIDFCVSFDSKSLFQSIHFLWAEAKKGNKSDILESFVQLILTIGKERTFEAELPPLFLGAFDCEKIALIPYHDIFSVSEVGAKEAFFASNFMHDFINGKIKLDSPCYAESLSKDSQNTKSEKGKQGGGFEQKDFYVEQTSFIPTKPLSFSDEAKAVFKAGRELWAYYHAQDFNDSKNPYNANASLYDIKAYFQGFNDKGKMNPPQKAQDSHYKNLIGNLNYELKILTKKIEPKIYEYGFLLE